MKSNKELFQRRRDRVRKRLRRDNKGRPRLSVFRSNKHIYAQVIDDIQGTTLATASSLEKDLRGSLKCGSDVAAAAEVGKVLAERALKAGVTKVVLDRGGYRFHGRIKALSDAAREAGLTF